MKASKILVIAASWIFGSGAHGATVLGTGTAALVGGDLTDPEDDGLPDEDVNYNATFFASVLEGFGERERSYNIFDGEVGARNAKTCCANPTTDPNGIWIGAIFDQPYQLTSFTLASSNDTPPRDPTFWVIEGSNDTTDGTDGTWTVIYEDDVAGTLWTARNQVIRYSPADGDVFLDSGSYTAFRFRVTATGNNTQFALNEFEIFGTPGSSSEPVISSISVSGTTATVVMKGTPGVDYYCAGSSDLQNWESVVFSTMPDGAFQTDDQGDFTFEVDISLVGPTYFFRIQETDPGM